MIPRKPLSTTVLAALLWTGCASRQPGSPIKPGFNIFSKDQEVQIGREAAVEVRKQVEVVKDSELQSYISTLGRRLASNPAAGDYPYSFTLVNDRSINAFALPGGPVFANSGLISHADNEAQVAGVLAHEIAHVALRHATNQASKANLLQLPAALAAAAIGQGSTVTQLGQLGLGLGVQSAMLRYSRDAETQADALGARLMSEAGYNPLEMARFFEKLEGEGGARAPQFLSSHPNPGNRRKAVEAEVGALPTGQYGAETGRFREAQAMVAQLPPPKRAPERAAARGSQPPPLPSGGFRRLNAARFALSYPDDWEAFADRDAVTIVPRGGLVENRQGGVDIAHGAVARMVFVSPQAQFRQLQGTFEQMLRSLDL